MDTYQPAIAALQQKLAEQEKQVADTKRLLNMLCEVAGLSPMFATVEATETPALTAIKGDTFYGVPLATAVTTYLRMRKASNLGPAKVADIHTALLQGGFQFDAKNDDYARRGLTNSLSKNTGTFHRLPNGDFGLMEWYPAVKQARANKAAKPATNGASDTGTSGDDATEDEDDGEPDFGDGDGDSDDAPEPTPAAKPMPGAKVTAKPHPKTIKTTTAKTATATSGTPGAKGEGGAS